MYTFSFSKYLVIIISFLVITTAEHFDYIVFAQQWPATTCTMWKSRRSDNQCNFPNYQVWTVHGIWPSKSYGAHPSFCESPYSFDYNEISPIEFELSNQWTDVQRKSNKYQFWEYEWKKHGTCASDAPNFGAPLVYFKRGLELHRRYDLVNMLERRSIVPDNNRTYGLQDIENAVSSVIRVLPNIVCVRSHGYCLISEIRICFDKNLSIQDCPHSESNCDSIVLYPNTQIR